MHELFYKEVNLPFNVGALNKNTSTQLGIRPKHLVPGTISLGTKWRN
jgi:hypothetical protein